MYPSSYLVFVYVLSGPCNNLIATVEMQLLIVEPKYANLDQISAHVDLKDNSLHARSERAQVTLILFFSSSKLF